MKNRRNLSCDYHRSRPLKSAKQHLDKLELFWKEGLWAEEVKFECFGHNDKQEGGGGGRKYKTVALFASQWQRNITKWRGQYIPVIIIKLCFQMPCIQTRDEVTGFYVYIVISIIL